MANMERIQPNARQALSYAQDEAEYLQNSAIDTEHVLVGLVREEHGIAGRVLRELGASREIVQTIVEQMSRSPMPRMSSAQPELSPGVKRMLELAVDEARRMSHHTIDTQHLLLGLLRLNRDKVLEVLRYLHIDPDIVRRRIYQEMERGEGNLPSQN